MVEKIISASLTPEHVEHFDCEHDEMLKNSSGDEFVTPHRIIAKVLVYA